VKNPRFKPLIVGAVLAAATWGLAVVGYRVAQNARMTPEKMSVALRATDLSKLDAGSRTRRLRDLASKFNALSREDRHRARRDPAWDGLWREMNDLERGDFIDRTMPTGFRQMINAFEEMPQDKRRNAVTNTLARLQMIRDGDLPPEQDTNRPPPLARYCC
jgi:hypothetical protein